MENTLGKRFESYKSVLEKLIWFSLLLIAYTLLEDGKNALAEPKVNILLIAGILGFTLSTVLLLYLPDLFKKYYND